MKYTAALLFLSFIGIAVFGFVSMNHSMMQGENCIVSAVMGNPCPINQGSFALHHLAALAVFSNSLPSAIFNVSPLIALSFALVLLAFLGAKGPYSRPPSFAYALRRRNVRHRSHTLRFMRWLALLEHSPSF